MPFQHADVSSLNEFEAGLFYFSDSISAATWAELRTAVEALSQSKLQKRWLRYLSQFVN